MSNKFQIEIPKPCHENWNKMDPVEQGRFCNSCQKAVVDFTGMSDAQLIAFFKKPSTGSICGRFDDDQLGRQISIPGKRMPWLKYFLNLLVPTFLFACKAKTQGAPRLMGDTILVETKKVLKDENGNIKKEIDNPKELKGKVVDERGIGIPYATVVMKGVRIGATSDESGNYKLNINKIGPDSILIFSAIGYNEAEVPITAVMQKPDYTLKLYPAVMGKMVVTGRGFKEKKKGKKRD